MPGYRIFDRVLDSTIEIPELPETTGAADYRFALGEGKAGQAASGRHVHDWLLPDGSVSMQCFRAGAAYRLVFPGLVAFLLVPSPPGAEREGSGNPDSPAAEKERGESPPGRAHRTWDITAALAGDTGLVTVRHLLLDQVIPRLVGHGGQLVVHAAAVQLQCGRTVAFLGETGAGKSTLAAAFQGRGARVLSDDCLLLKQEEGAVQCLPAYRGLRLWPDSLEELLPADIETAPMAHYAGKRRVAGASRAEAAGTGAPEWRELSTLFLLDGCGSDLQIAIGTVGPDGPNRDVNVAPTGAGAQPGGAGCRSDLQIATGHANRDVNVAPTGAGAQPGGAGCSSDLQIAIGEHVQLAPAGGRTAVMALIGSLFTLDVPDPQRAGAAFANAVRLANSGLPVYRLGYPRAFERLPSVCQAVETQFG